MLLEKSFQAQALIPMATSLAFGLLGSTLLVLLMVPLLYHFYVLLTFTDEERFGVGVEGSDSTGVSAIENGARVDTGGLATSS